MSASIWRVCICTSRKLMQLLGLLAVLLCIAGEPGAPSLAGLCMHAGTCGPFGIPPTDVHAEKSPGQVPQVCLC